MAEDVKKDKISGCVLGSFRNSFAQTALTLRRGRGEAMAMQRFSPLFLALGVAILGLQGYPTQARSLFDGPWAVTLTTESGFCDAAYRYAVVVTEGNVISDIRESIGTITLSGKIDADGRVSVNVRQGEQRADGTGKLSETAGSGTWTGKSSSAACAGRWEAKRN